MEFNFRRKNSHDTLKALPRCRTKIIPIASVFLVLVLGCQVSTASSTKISADDLSYPKWFEKIISWHEHGLISDDDFSNAVSYLMERGIIQHTSGMWHPRPGTKWNVQLNGRINQSPGIEVYNIDLFDNDKSVVDSLHASGNKAVCYFSAGSWEDWRVDAGSFPASVVGNDYSGWPGEKWLDIRQIDTVGPIMQKRLDLCKQKGFDGVDADNVDSYLQDTGFSITYQDQLNYNMWLADEAHRRGLAIGLKNDLAQVNDLVDHFDWASNEQCLSYHECDMLLAFVMNDKAVFHVEYVDMGAEFNAVCANTPHGFSTILKTRALNSTLFESCDDAMLKQ
ncbi:MAG: hypothetical protein EPO62_00345 [Candidatus Nitrosotenuis sp.]|nr:MAG: hypothetical protein EPO62_00345 [Candidatus Nitrosotenuis sp.]